MEAEKIAFLSILINSTSVFLLFISIIFIWLQIKKNHDWNRRKSAQELINDYNYGNFHPIRDKFLKAIGGKKELENGNYMEYASKLNSEELLEFHFVAMEIFNFFETLSVFVIDNVVDETICYHYFQDIFLRYFNWFKPYFNQIRKEGREYDYAFEIVAQKWVHQQTKDDKLSNKKILSFKKRKL